MSSRVAGRALAVAALGLVACAPSVPASQPTSGRASAPDSSRTSLDWPGSYTGVVPCADCEGIETTLTLRADLRYTLRTRYLGTDDSGRTLEGRFAWDDAGSAITLEGVSQGASRYLVGENALYQLDLDGERITGDLADRYVLRKTGDASSLVPEALVAPARWRLTELLGRPVAAASDPERQPSLAFDRDGRSVHGFAGCNHFAGTIELREGNRIRFSRVASTQMACSEMATEAEFLRILGTADSYALVGRTLTLQRARMAPLARLEAVYP